MRSLLGVLALVLVTIGFAAVAVGDEEADEAPPAPIQWVGETSGGRVLHLPRPAYSDFALSARIEGRVVVQVLVKKNGRVAPRTHKNCTFDDPDKKEKKRWHEFKCARVLSGPEVFWPDVLFAAEGARFERRADSSMLWANITYDFRIR